MMKKDEILKSEEAKSFYKAFLKLRNEEEMKNFLSDLMSVKELQMFSARWQAAQMLQKGMAYEEIVRLTGLSSATIAKVSESLKFGYDGFKIVYERSKDK